jgi:hypothetical protein
MTDHAHTEVALPLCAACCKPITFYMHQDYSKTTGMVYFHPECCPSCKRQTELMAIRAPSIHALIAETERVLGGAL